MSEFKYEVGDEFKGPYEAWMKVVARNRTGHGIVQYWTVDEYGEACTRTEYTLDMWTKIEPFFEIGDTFTSPWSPSATMTVTHLDDEFKMAWVTAIGEDGSTTKKSVGAITWKHAKEEILRNRKA